MYYRLIVCLELHVYVLGAILGFHDPLATPPPPPRSILLSFLKFLRHDLVCSVFSYSFFISLYLALTTNFGAQFQIKRNFGISSITSKQFVKIYHFSV